MSNHIKQTNRSGSTNAVMIDEGHRDVPLSDWQPNATSRRRTLRVPGRSRPCNDTGAILRPRAYSPAERELAALARKVAMNRDVLYHGTRDAQSAIRMVVLFHPQGGNLGYPVVSFTRSPEEAAYWALLKRDDDEGRGGILIFDRQSLKYRYKIEPCHDPVWDTATICRDEAEEQVWDDVIDIGRHLIGFVSEKTTYLSDKLTTLNQERRLEMEHRLNELQYHVPEWRHRPEEQIELQHTLLLRQRALELSQLRQSGIL